MALFWTEPLINLPAQNGPADFEHNLASDLVAEARRAIAEDEVDTARFLLRRAHSVDSDAGDALYLLATLQPHNRDTVNHRERLLRRAYTIGTSTVSPDNVVSELARLLIDTDRAGEAVTLLDEHIRERDGQGAVHQAMQLVTAADRAVPRPADSISPSTLDMRFLEALLQSDPGWFSSALLMSLRAGFPEDDTLAYLDWRRTGSLSPALPEWLGSVILSGNADSLDSEPFREVVLGFLDLLPAEQSPIRYFMTDFYYTNGGKDPLPAVEFLFLYDDPEYLVQIDLEAADKRIWEVAAQYSAVGEWPESLPEPLRTAAAGLFEETVELVEKARTGLGKTLYHMESGALRRWSKDSNGDGLFDQVAELRGSVLRLYEREGNVIVRVDYSPYPLVAEVRKIPMFSPVDVESDWIIEIGPETVDFDNARRWLPSQPVPFDPGFIVQTQTGTSFPSRIAEILEGRVLVEKSLHDRFVRQLASDTARVFSEFEGDEYTRYLRVLGLIR